MVSRDHLTHSKAIQRRSGATFHLATRFLPERTRHPTYVLYAFFRIADEVVDDPNPGPAAAQRRDLALIRDGALGDERAREALAAREEGSLGADAAPVLAAFDELRRRHEIPDGEVEVFVEAMERDVEATDYADHEELSTYLRGSSVAVANMMLSVMEPDDVEAARPHAEAMAEAFQLTNFLRDVREDVEDYGRVYLPQSSLATHGATTADVRALRPTDGLLATIRDELERTEGRYRDGVAGIRYLPPDCQPAVLLAAVLYAEHHRLIRECGYDVITKRPTLSVRRRLALAARTWFHWRRTRDPEAVFYRVAAVDRSPAERTVADVGPVDDTEENPSLIDGARSLADRPLGRVARVVPWGRD